MAPLLIFNDGGLLDLSVVAKEFNATQYFYLDKSSSKLKGLHFGTPTRALQFVRRVVSVAEISGADWVILLEDDVRVWRRISVDQLQFVLNGDNIHESLERQGGLVPSIDRLRGCPVRDTHYGGAGGAILSGEYLRSLGACGSDVVLGWLTSLYEGSNSLASDQILSSLVLLSGYRVGTWPGYKELDRQGGASAEVVYKFLVPQSSPTQVVSVATKTALLHRSQSGSICLNKDFAPKHELSVWTMVTDDPNYVSGALVLGRSVKKHISNVTVDLVLMELKNKPLNERYVKSLSSVGWMRCGVERISPLERTFPRFEDQFTKLRLWGMIAYKTILYLDSDAFVIGSLDTLLSIKLHGKSIGVARDISAGKWLESFNMGVFLIRPSYSEYERLLKMQSTPGAVKFNPTMAEQAFLNAVYKAAWLDVGFVYNANLLATRRTEKHGIDGHMTFA